MKRPQAAAAIVAGILALAAACPSAAAVTYDFELFFEDAFHLPDGRFTYVSPDYITDTLVVPTGGAKVCLVPPFGSEFCNHPQFQPFPDADVLVFGIGLPPPSGFLVYTFAPGAFGKAGVYDVTGLSLPARLTITQSAVPEPATWMLLLLGIGGAGAVLRRRSSAMAGS